MTEKIKNLATNFVTSHFFEKRETAENTFNLINFIFQQAIKTYCETKKFVGIEIRLETKIRFISKGGLVFYMLKNRIIKEVFTKKETFKEFVKFVRSGFKIKNN